MILLLLEKRDSWSVRFMNIEETKWESMIVVNTKTDMNLVVRLSARNVEVPLEDKRFISVNLIKKFSGAVSSI